MILKILCEGEIKPTSIAKISSSLRYFWLRADEATDKEIGKGDGQNHHKHLLRLNLIYIRFKWKLILGFAPY
jgi:hypothetical protein